MAETFSFLMIQNSELKMKLQNDNILKKKSKFYKNKYSINRQKF